MGGFFELWEKMKKIVKLLLLFTYYFGITSLSMQQIAF